MLQTHCDPEPSAAPHWLLLTQYLPSVKYSLSFEMAQRDSTAGRTTDLTLKAMCVGGSKLQLQAGTPAAGGPAVKVKSRCAAKT